MLPLVQLPLGPPSSPDHDQCRFFLASLIENTGAGALLLQRLVAFDKTRVPAAVKPLCDRAVRLTFACILKHMNRWKLAMADAIEPVPPAATKAAPSPEEKMFLTIAPPPNSNVIKFFRTAVTSIHQHVANIHAATGDSLSSLFLASLFYFSSLFKMVRTISTPYVPFSLHRSLPFFSPLFPFFYVR